MTCRERTAVDCRPRIERRVETALDDGRAPNPVARGVVEEYDDRWYGQLLVRSSRSVTGPADSESIRAAAAAIELLRGYCRLRSELRVQLTDDVAHSVTRDPTATLRAAERLRSTAYATLGEIDHPSIGPCFETFSDVSDRVREAVGTGGDQSPTTAGHCSLIDETAGVLGEGAAVIGATLAGVDDAHRDRFAAVGRGLGTADQIRRTLNGEAGSVRVVSPEPDKELLRRHARDSFAEAERALGSLSAIANVNRLQPLLATIDEFER